MKGNYRSGQIVRIDKETGEVKYYESQYLASLDGFCTSKIGESCRNPKYTYKGYFWNYSHEFNSDTYITRKELNSVPKRQKSTTDTNIKVCTKCKIIKTFDNFPPGKRGKFGYHSWCRDCSKKHALGRARTDEQFRLRKNLRKRLNHALKQKKWHKNTNFNKYIGCSLEELKTHLESQFKPGMTWENYTLFGWHVDHIIPLCSAKTEDDLYKLCHYTNLQPLWREENLRKGGG